MAKEERHFTADDLPVVKDFAIGAIWGSIPGPAKSDLGSSMASHCSDVSSELCDPDGKPRTLTPPLVTSSA